MSANKVNIGEFLFERKGKYKPDDERISGLKRLSKIDFSGNFHITQKPSRTKMILIKPGDLVISGINVSKGAMGIYNGKEDVVATIHYSSYTFDSEIIDIEYFKRFIKSDAFLDLLKEQVKGGIKTEIKPKHILPLEIDLPEINGQSEIVNHFQNIENEDEELKQEICNQQSLLKKLRQQILQEAIEGNLTKDLREENPNVEPASELLKRIKAEKDNWKKKGSFFDAINRNIIENKLIALPSTKEQNTIVEKVEKLMAICDEMEKEINQNKEYSEKLMPAVLGEAFEGRNK